VASSGLKNAPVSVLGLPENVRDSFSNRRVWQGVAEIAEMARNQKDKVIRLAWPAEAYQVYRNQGYREDFQLAHAWTFLPIAHLVGLLDTIRNRVLTFALEMGALDLGIEEDALDDGLKKVHSAQINQTFHQTIYGPNTNVGSAGSFSQTVIDNRGNITALKDQLRGTGIPEPDIQELEKAIKADEGKVKSGQFGDGVGKWIGDTIKKAATGAIGVGMNVVATDVVKHLANYYGIGGS
jgi:AbiTii